MIIGRGTLFLLLLTPTIMLCAAEDHEKQMMPEQKQKVLDQQLISAISANNIALTKELLRAKADIYNKDYQPLFFATSGDMARCLIEHKAKVDGMYSGRTALHWAVAHDAHDAAKILIECKADVNAADNESAEIAPIHLAKSVLLTELLIECKANINQQDGWGDTLLHEAVSQNNAEVTKLLIRRGARIDVPNDDSETPLYIALSQYNKELARVLIDAGAKLKNRISGKQPIDLLLALVPGSHDSPQITT